MEDRKQRFGAGVLMGVFGTLLVLLLIAIAIAYSGGYNVAASTGHTAGVRWWLDTLMHSSVRSHAPEVDVSARLANADIAAGAAEYKEYCEHCHGGVGVDAPEFARGMLPTPPSMQHAATEWEPSELFWIIRHGIKYTGMPAFGADHGDATLWNITAFVEQLPAMTPEQYAAFESEGHGHHGSGESDDEKSAGKESTESIPHSEAGPHDH